MDGEAGLQAERDSGAMKANRRFESADNAAHKTGASRLRYT